MPVGAAVVTVGQEDIQKTVTAVAAVTISKKARDQGQCFRTTPMPRSHSDLGPASL